MQHFIRKQIIELFLDKKPDVSQLQHIVSTQYWEKIITLLENKFDEMGAEDIVIEIDKLEIDIGPVAIGDIENGKWIDMIAEILNQKVHALKNDQTSSMKIRKQSRPLSISDQWLFYMQHGYLPWNVLEIDESWYKNVLEAFASDSKAIDRLRSTIRLDKDATVRIVLQHDQQFLLSLVATLTARNQNELPLVIEEVAALIIFLQDRKKDITIQGRRIFLQIWEQVFQLAAAGMEMHTPGTLAYSLLNFYEKDLREIIKLPDEYLPGMKIIFPALAQIRKRLIEQERQNAQSEISPDAADQKKTFENFDIEKNKTIDPVESAKEKLEIDTTTVTGSESKIEDRTPGKPDAITEKISKAPEEQLQQRLNKDEVEEQFTPTIEKNKIIIPGEEETDFAKDESTGQLIHIDENDSVKINHSDEIGEEEIFVRYAGVVLVHSFLAMFFERLGLVKERNFVDLLSQQKALHLLHYLATGNKEPQEHELVMAKILCAYPLQKPIAINIELTTEELEEADHLLAVVLKRWEILKDSSVAALRQEFLQRNGKLYSSEGDLFIHVETKSIDVLLSHLPWNLHWIKLPWMKDILKVKWG